MGSSRPYRPHHQPVILNIQHSYGRETAVTCPNCGATAQQGSDGSWACGNCGPISGTAPAPESAGTGIGSMA